MVPPALSKVGKLALESVLQQLKPRTMSEWDGHDNEEGRGRGQRRGVRRRQELLYLMILRMNVSLRMRACEGRDEENTRTNIFPH